MENSPIETKTSINIDKKDIVDVALAKIESTLLLKTKQLKKEISDTEATLIDLGQAIEDIIQDVSHQEVAEGLVMLIDGIKRLGGKGESFSVKGTASTHVDGIPREITVQVSFQRKIVVFTTTVATPPALVQNLYPKRSSLHAYVESKKLEVISLKDKLRKLPMMERQIKARVVEVELSKTDLGRSVLLQIDESYLDGLVKQICE